MGVQVYWACVSALLAILTITDMITIGLILGLTVLSSIAQTFDGATRQTVLARVHALRDETAHDDTPGAPAPAPARARAMN